MDDRSGFITFLSGIVILIVVSVFLSLAVEKRFAFSSEKISVEQTVEADAESAATLKRQLADTANRLERSTRRLSQINAKDESLGKLLRERAAKIQKLTAEKAELKAALVGANDAFVAYQSDYRNRVWSEAIGKAMAVLKTRSGREYLDVEILNVTQAGIDIRHQSGRARLGPREFSDDWQDRFQWSVPGSRLDEE